MKRRNKIIYWVATLWLSLGMISTGIVQLLETGDSISNFSSLGYPQYLMPFLAILKILGVIALLVPRYPIIKEWAYAGFIFLLAGAIFSHWINGDKLSTMAGPFLLVVLTVISWSLRPKSKKIMELAH